MLIAQVVLPVPFPRVFDYLIPTHITATPYARVKVPFGKNNKNVIGIITAIQTHSVFESNKLKPITELLDHAPIFPASLQKLLLWASDYYCYPLGEVLFQALPVLLRQDHAAYLSAFSDWQLTEQGQTLLTESKKGTIKQRQTLELLVNSHQSSYHLKSQGITERTLHALQQKGWISEIVSPQTTAPWSTTFYLPVSPLTLTDEQINALTQLKQHLNAFTPWLLEGVTGSGKTEVYLQLIAEVLKQGQQVLVLIPEIGLTPQTFSRFKQRLNAPIDMLHSGLNNNERLAVWLRAKEGQNAVVLGTRSALFTPFQSLGLIIIDEEHDSSFKQQEGWRYHARDMAIMRAKEENIPILLGSATPSLESLYNVLQQKYRHLQLTQRTSSSAPLKQHVLPLLGKKLTAGLAQPLIDEMKKHLKQNNQVLLFLNRRGFSPVVLCHECGWIAECPRCESYYTYHQQQNKLYCHHCDSQKKMPQHCPKCHSTQLIPIGVGTEQLEATLPTLFPEIPITRIDSDTTARKGSLEHYLNEIQQGGARILIGTQILAKGHHFPDVTLVGILNVDGALFSTNFRATEHFAQLYTQVAGRAGREAKDGEVILQTHYPDHPLLLTLLKQGYHQLALQLLIERQEVSLPPYSYQAMLRTEAVHAPTIIEFLQQIKQQINTLQHTHQLLTCDVSGPFPAAQTKRAGKYRWQLLIQHEKRSNLHQLLKELLPFIYQHTLSSKIRWSIEIDPIDY